MAEVVVGSLMLKIGSALKAKLSQKAVRGDLADIKEELQEIQHFIREADMASEDRESVAVWLNQLRETAYDIEDILDESIYLAGEQKRGGLRALTPKSLHNSKKSCSPKGVISPCVSLMHRKSIAAAQLNELKIRVADILERGKRYDVWKREKTLVYKEARERRTTESSLVGMESNKKTLIDWLTDETEELMKISVWGMGGLGKTTLVDLVYNSEEIGKRFKCRAWITVSQTYVIVDMLRSVIKEILINKKESVPQDIDAMNKEMLIGRLHHCLRHERYLIVLDDVWSESVWHEIRDACPKKNNCRSRIMFTTRNFEVATSLASPHRVFELKPLQYDQAWELLCKSAFQGDLNGNFPQDFKDSATAIVNKCDGLPLAIVVQAGLMHSKHSVSEWSSDCNSLNVIPTNNVELSFSVLMRSFYDLPHYLKNCFLYCSVFPEDYGIKRKRVIRLWVAEGFVEEREGKTLEEVAEEYFNELIHRSMLQVTKRNDWERPKECRMHSVMRQLAISISKKQNFCIVCEDCEEHPTATARRLSIIEVSDTIITVLGRISGLRSLLVFATDASTSKIMATLSFRLLRVLDLHGAPIVSIPDAVSTLFHLRYFSVRQTEVNALPEDLEKLLNLQTLDLQYSGVQKLPSVVKLHNLRHLFMIRSVDKTGLSVGMQTPGTAWSLKDLQTLEGIVSNKKVVREVQNLEKLRSFVILEVKKSDGAALCASIEKMTFLNNLQVQDEGEGLELETLASPPSPLQKLFLVGHLQRLPRWFSFLNSLKVLRLQSSGLNEDPFCSLQSLPMLLCLELHKAYAGEELQCEEGGFLSLKTLRLIELNQLKQIRMGTGALGSLRELHLSRCRELNALPQGIKCLTTLEKLYFEVSEELLQRMQPNGGEYHKISHIPTVDLTLRDDVI
ncbi:Disease resistance protein RPM1 [Acorus calamus]|uniref:Disease resistance protein RPM1 n=1 Tax=Acorus calamus TaxID=4465 RepID=A0AAV9EVY9_ACOCL|nr:Disease resistance protein RPM1 [Acorus calamus]